MEERRRSARGGEVPEEERVHWANPWPDADQGSDMEFMCIERQEDDDMDFTCVADMDTSMCGCHEEDIDTRMQETEEEGEAEMLCKCWRSGQRA